jgi:hypothetical protein
VAVLSLVGVTIIVATVGYTLLRYGDLPERVPIQFDSSGNARAYGPRYAIWLVPAVQIFAAVLWLFALGRSSRTLIVVDAALALCLASQVMFVSTATSGGKRLNRPLYWAFTVVAFAVIGAAMLAAVLT